MKKDKEQRKQYETPVTTCTAVELEQGICASSKEKVVIDNNNTTVDINRQDEGGSFEIDTWNEN